MKTYIVLFALIFTISTGIAHDITIQRLRVEYKEGPFIEELKPRLSWELHAAKNNQFQQAYRILVSSSLAKSNADDGDLWDSGKVQSARTNQITYEGYRLASRQRVWWKVKVWDGQGREGAWSEVGSWEMGLLTAVDWQAKWIGKDLNDLAQPGKYHLPPLPYLRKSVNVTKRVKSARLYISSLGLHEFYINGHKIGKDYFSSGWTDYNKRVYYQIYDVTAQLSRGENIFGAILADGWYAGYLGYALLVGSPQVRGFYGDTPLLKAQIEVLYSDGTKSIIATDESWKVNTGAIMEADFLQGETYDATKELLGWKSKGFDDHNWGDAQIFPNKQGQMVQLYPGHPVRVVDQLSIRTITPRGGGKYILDFGQNFAGNIKINIKGKCGDTLTFRFGEMLHPDGRLVTENLRSARATDKYIIRGDKHGETWSPSFTFHGFQYVEVSGLQQAPTKDFAVGLVLSSDLEIVGQLETDNDLLNQLYSNIVWTQRANYLDIPTDCPQRDERLGWTGDAQVYMRSAQYNNDIAAFHKKWLRDLQDAQWPNGAYPIYAPMPVNERGVAAIRVSDTYSPGWSDAGIICTYEIYKAYGDTRIIEEALPYMIKFMDFLEKKAGEKNIFVEGSFEEIKPKGGFGDWLSIGKKTGPDLLASLYYFYCARLMEEMCLAIKQGDPASRFKADAEKIKAEFLNYYCKDGRFQVNDKLYGNGEGYVEGKKGFSGHTQTAYANAIYMGILDQQDLAFAGQFLRELVEKNNDKLTTGFLGFKPLLPALSKTGSSDKAYKLLLNTEYPSLGYEIVNGATSIWERWDSYNKDKGFVHNASMNSFSHYAFGAVNEWMFECMAGIQSVEPGYRTILIKPELPPDEVSLRWIKGSYRSINGLIRSEWYKKDEWVDYVFEIPVNTTAYIQLYLANKRNVSVNGQLLDDTNLVLSSEIVNEQLQLKLGSGVYNIRVKKVGEKR